MFPFVSKSSKSDISEAFATFIVVMSHILSVTFKLTSLFSKSVISISIGVLLCDKYICLVIFAPFSSFAYISYNPSSLTSYTKFTLLLCTKSMFVPSLSKSTTSFISFILAIFKVEIILFSLVTWIVKESGFDLSWINVKSGICPGSYTVILLKYLSPLEFLAYTVYVP